MKLDLITNKAEKSSIKQSVDSNLDTILSKLISIEQVCKKEAEKKSN